MLTRSRIQRNLMCIVVAVLTSGNANLVNGQTTSPDDARLPQSYSGNPRPVFLEPGNDLRGPSFQTGHRNVVRLSSSGNAVILHGASERSALPAKGPVVPPEAVLAPAARAEGAIVYDGLPINEQSHESRPSRSGRAKVAADAVVNATVGDEPTTSENEQQSHPQDDVPQFDSDRNDDDQDDVGDMNEVEGNDANVDDGDDDDGDDDDGDDDEEDCEEQLDALDRVLASSSVQRILGLMEENLELQAQLKIQQVEFEAQQRIHEVEHAVELAERELQRLKQGGAPKGGSGEHPQRGPMGPGLRPRQPMEPANEEVGAELRRLREVVEQQRNQLEHLGHALEECQASRQTLEQQSEHMQEHFENSLAQLTNELQSTLQSRTELEHRARAQQAQLSEFVERQRGAEGAAAENQERESDSVHQPESGGQERETPQNKHKRNHKKKHKGPVKQHD